MSFATNDEIDILKNFLDYLYTEFHAQLSNGVVLDKMEEVALKWRNLRNTIHFYDKTDAHLKKNVIRILKDALQILAKSISEKKE